MSSSNSFSNNIDEDSHSLDIHIESPQKKAFNRKQILSELAVWRALFANVGIAAIKLVCFLLSGSSAMLSEAIHSAADGFNSFCLLVGLKRGSRPADKEHPFGYGLEANIWALFACILMLLGTSVAIYKGWHRLVTPEENPATFLDNINLLIFTLLGSITFEIWAVLSASSAVMEEVEVKTKNKFDTLIKSFKYIKHIKSPTTKFVWYEDTAALSGAAIALIAIIIAKFIPTHYAAIPDAIASIIIGLMLLGLAIYLLKHNISVLTGVAAKPQTEELIRDIASTVNGVSQVYDLKTMDMGPSGLIVNMEIEVDPETQVKEADDIADRLEEKLKEKVNNISHVTIEVQADDAEDNWEEKFVCLINEGKKLGILKKREAKMLKSFFDFTDTVVCEVMVPRTDIDSIDADSSINELMDVVITSGHTRIPIYREHIDNIIGVINAKDVLGVLKNNPKEHIKVENLAREVDIVPENKSISDMLNEFCSNKAQMAVVVDEHGGVAGIVTMEDLLEEIVGEIWDEYDVQVHEIIKIDQNTLSLISKMNINDLNDRFNLDLSTEDFQTIGGYVFGLLGREPEVGDEVHSNDIKLKVESMDGHKIIRVLLIKDDGFIDKHDIEEETEDAEEQEID